MNVLLTVTVEGLEDKINRQIIVSENIKLTDLFENIIVSMNGSKIPIYEINHKKIGYYPFEINESKYVKSLVGLTLKDLNTKKNEIIGMDYNFDKDYFFNIKVDDFINENNNSTDNHFEVISGNGYGIMDNESSRNLIFLLMSERKDKESYYKKDEKEYLQKVFDKDKINNCIKEYNEHKDEKFIPKSYILNVSLDGFNKEIKRKIKVNSDIIIDDFCEKIITSMNGDLSHLYDIKIGKECMKEYYGDLELFYLNLKEKQKFKIIYDFGDNWIFNITVSKISDYNNDRNFEVLGGKGYGIIDDCGGIWGLAEIFNGQNEYFEKCNIDDFDLAECNKAVE